MFWKCLGHVPAMLRTCFSNVTFFGMFWQCLVHALAMFGHVLGMFWASFGHDLTMFKQCFGNVLEHVWACVVETRSNVYQ